MQRTTRTLAILLTILLTSWHALAAEIATPGETKRQEHAAPDFRVTAPPEAVVKALGLSPFYKKHVDVGGFSVVASAKVPDAAVAEAAFLVDKMIGRRPELLAALDKNKVRLAVMNHDEFTTDIPEHSDLSPAGYWNKRARGLGATRERPAVSCATENLLCYPGDPYATENITIHEFAHAIHQMALSLVDPTFDSRLKKIYKASLAKGLWKGTYAGSNKEEFFAEGTQSWFDTNRANDSEHNDIDTREKLKKYDPDFAALLAEVYGQDAWHYRRPQDREAAERAHLAGYDFAKSPHFLWPKEVLEASRAVEREKAGRLNKLPVLPPGNDAPAASPPAGGATTVTFVNHTKDDLLVYWLDESGKRKEYARLQPGKSHEQNTFAGHVWVMTDPAGKVVGTAIASEKPGRVVAE